MRKHLFFITIVMLMVLLASCSKEDTMNIQGEDNRIRISAELPVAMAATRGEITIDANHQLRCIIEVWNKEETPVIEYREEVVVEAGQTPVFDFLLKSGDYDCLLWADFIKKGAAITKVTNSDGYEYNHYEDTYYRTEDLKNITIKHENADNLFDTNNCDAFFSRQELIKQEEETLSLSFSMERPLAKLIVKEKDSQQFAKLKKLNVSCTVPQGFNVFAGEPINKTMTATFSKTFSNDASQVLFTGYVFVPSTVEQSMETVVLGVTTSSTRNCEIPAGSIKLKRNQCTNAVGEIISGEGSIEPEPEGGDPKVGDYFFKDGTWSATLTDGNKGNCVGIVYATEPQAGDDIADYGERGAEKNILGYVISLKMLNIPADKLSMYKEQGTTTPFTALPKKSEASEGQEWNNDFTTNNGYHKTQNLLQQFGDNGGIDSDNYPALKKIYDWKEEQGGIIDNASEWYIPSARQILVAAGSFHGFVAPTGGDNDFTNDVSDINSIPILGTALKSAKDKGIADDVLLQEDCILFNSSLSNHKNGAAPIQVKVYKGKINRLKEGNGDSNKFVIRPILTILK